MVGPNPLPPLDPLHPLILTTPRPLHLLIPTIPRPPLTPPPLNTFTLTPSYPAPPGPLPSLLPLYPYPPTPGPHNPLIHHLTLYSPNAQQSVRQWRPFANDNEANAHKTTFLVKYGQEISHTWEFSYKRSETVPLGDTVISLHTLILHSPQWEVPILWVGGWGGGILGKILGKVPKSSMRSSNSGRGVYSWLPRLGYSVWFWQQHLTSVKPISWSSG